VTAAAPTVRSWRELYTGPVEPDGEYYTHPATGQQFVRVSTVLDTVSKDALVPWAAGLAAAAAFAELPRVVASSRTRPCGRTHTKCKPEHDWQIRCDSCACGDCRECVQKVLTNRHWVESSRRADEGTRVHKLIEQWVLSGGIMPDHTPDLAPYVAMFHAFVADYGLMPDSWEMAESTILNHTDGWGGTLDGQVRFSWGRTELADDLCARLGKVGSDVVVTLDGKTREGEGARIYVDHALQLAAYRRGEVLLLRDGTEHPLPPTDGAAILQMRPDGYALRPVVADEVTYEAFRSALALWRWLDGSGDASVQVRTFPLPEDYKRAKANRKARDRRASAKASGTPQSVHRFPMNGAKPAAKPAPAAKTTATKTAPPAAARRTTAESLGIPRDAFSGPRALSDDTIPF
jgi:hypothetical protein